jgi:apolipoprotein N-acyltransferase
LELSAAEREVDALIWPETSFPVLVSRSEDFRPMITRAAGGATAVVGAQRFGPEGNPRNTMIVLDGADGEVVLTHDKHHLVPFGEYLPLPAVAEMLGIGGLAQYLAGTYQPGAGPITFDLPGIGSVLPMICYEAIFPQYLWQVERPKLLLHLTNDAWFGNFAGPYQHLSLARLRAAESGLPLMRSANTGVTAVIDARGTVLDQLPLNEAGFLDAALPAALPPTPYARWGEMPVMLLLITLAGLVALNRKAAAH